MYDVKDLQDPNKMFEKRLTYMWNRIQILDNDYHNVNHYFSKAIIETELENLVDEYIERSFVLQKIRAEESQTKE